jgi:uncharacterized protein (DUF2267 family)
MSDDSEGFGEERRDAKRTQVYALFLKHLRETSDLPGERAEKALRSVLCALEQWLLGDEVEELRARLPPSLRDALHACLPRRERLLGRSGADELLQRVAEDTGGDPPLAESVTRAVFSTVRTHISEGEAEQVGDELPADLRALWARPI